MDLLIYHPRWTVSFYLKYLISVKIVLHWIEIFGQKNKRHSFNLVELYLFVIKQEKLTAHLRPLLKMKNLIAFCILLSVELK